MIKLAPVANELPPTGSAYQLIVPDDAEAFNVTVPVLHLEASVVEVIVGLVFTVAVTAVLLAVVQPLSVAST